MEQFAREIFKPSLCGFTGVLAALLASGGACAATTAYDFSPVTAQINTLVQSDALDGASLIVMRNGAPIYEHYFGSYSASTNIPIASASKWLSALTIERLVEQGKLHWGDTVGQYFPTAPAAARAITLGQMFSHTSGITTDDAPCIGDRGTTLDACAQQILTLPLIYAPGTRFAYAGNAMQVGGRMAEIATGKPWSQIFSEQLTGPLAMPNTSFLTASASPISFGSANPQIAGGVKATAGDYLRVMQMVAQHGAWNGTQILSGAGLTDMQRDQTHAVPVLYTPDPQALGYGYGEWRNLVDANGNAIQVSSTGKFGTSPWVDNETGVSAVFLVDSSYSKLTNDLRVLWSNVRTVVQAADAQAGAVSADQFGVSGAWYDPATSGQGLVIAAYPDISGAGKGILSAGWYTYDTSAAGAQRWYTLQGDANAGAASSSLGIYAASGGNFNAPPTITANKVGSATLRFSDCTHATLNYSFSDGSARIGVISLTRLDTNISCGAAGSSPGNFQLSGAWYNPNTSGQGLVIDVNPLNSLFSAGWYTFAQNGSAGGAAGQRWYIIQDNAFAPGMTSKSGLPIYETSGGTFNTSGGVINTQVGTASILFSGCSSASLTYHFSNGSNAGLDGSIALSRIGPAPAGCTLP